MEVADSSIKTVIFDLGGVYFTDGAKQFSKKMEDVHGVPVSAVIDVIGGELGDQYRTGRITPDEFWMQAKKYWQLDIDTTELSKIWLDGYEPIEGTADLIDRLKKSGYELLFLSDNAPDRVDYLESRFAFLSKFDGGVFSHLEKVRKPDPKIYKAALALTASPATACVYIDDKPKLLEPAKTLGMSTIAFESPEQVESELLELGLQF